MSESGKESFAKLAWKDDPYMRANYIMRILEPEIESMIETRSRYETYLNTVDKYTVDFPSNEDVLKMFMFLTNYAEYHKNLKQKYEALFSMMKSMWDMDYVENFEQISETGKLKVKDNLTDGVMLSLEADLKEYIDNNIPSSLDEEAFKLYSEKEFPNRSNREFDDSLLKAMGSVDLKAEKYPENEEKKFPYVHFDKKPEPKISRKVKNSLRNVATNDDFKSHKHGSNSNVSKVTFKKGVIPIRKKKI